MREVTLDHVILPCSFPKLFPSRTGVSDRQLNCVPLSSVFARPKLKSQFQPLGSSSSVFWRSWGYRSPHLVATLSFTDFSAFQRANLALPSAKFARHILTCVPVWGCKGGGPEACVEAMRLKNKGTNRAMHDFNSRRESNVPFRRISSQSPVLLIERVWTASCSIGEPRPSKRFPNFSPFSATRGCKAYLLNFTLSASASHPGARRDYVLDGLENHLIF